MRFGTSAGATFAALTTDVTCGAVNAEDDSLNPIAALSPMVGMWLNCVFGGKGVGMINMLMFIIVGDLPRRTDGGTNARISGQKDRRARGEAGDDRPARHPIMILGPRGCSPRQLGNEGRSNPGAHGFQQILYQFSSASANNGSAFDGLGVTYGFNNNSSPSPEAVPWDIATGLVMLFSRFLPIIAPIAMAASLGRQEIRPVRPRHAARRHRHVRIPAVWGRSLSSARCSFCRSPCSDRWPSILARSLSAADPPRHARSRATLKPRSRPLELRSSIL